MPAAASALAAWLARDRDFRGIGPALATRLHDAFGSRLRDALLNRNPRIVEILGEELATATFGVFDFKAPEADVAAWLDEQGIAAIVGHGTAITIARCWGGVAVGALAENPYLLTAFLPWHVVETVAEVLGVPRNDQRRWIAAVEATLYAKLDAGHTFAAESDVEAGAAELLHGGAALAGSPANGLKGLVDAAVESGAAVRIEGGVQPFGAAYMEEETARWVADAAVASPRTDLFARSVDAEGAARLIDAFKAGRPHALTERQRAAIATAVMHRVTLLAGYAGSGKTTALRGLCEVAEALGRDLHLMALSGRAARRMTEATDRPARTIAGFLRQAAGQPPIPSSMVVIDEASMLDLATLWRIVSAVGDASLVLVGDPAQLPPIGFGFTFQPFYDARHGLPRVVLDRVLRQSEDSGIPALAEAIRFGRLPELPLFAGRRPGMSFLPCDASNAADTIARIGRTLVSEGARREDMQVLGPIRSGPAGIEAINRRFHETKQRSRGEVRFPGRNDIGRDDPVIWTRNDWERELVNGSLGRIDGILRDTVEATIDGRPYELSAADAGSLELAYAISVHKAQGSQWPIVVVPVFPSRILDRTLVYIAITRATRQIVLVGQHEALRRAVERPSSAGARSVGIAQRLAANLRAGNPVTSFDAAD